MANFNEPLLTRQFAILEHIVELSNMFSWEIIPFNVRKPLLTFAILLMHV